MNITKFRDAGLHKRQQGASYHMLGTWGLDYMEFTILRHDNEVVFRVAP